jgi:subtilisin family serine protease
MSDRSGGIGIRRMSGLLLLAAWGCGGGGGNGDADASDDAAADELDVAEDAPDEELSEGDAAEADALPPLPVLNCAFGFVDNDLGEPDILELSAVRRPERTADAVPLHLRSRAVGPSGFVDLTAVRADAERGPTPVLVRVEPWARGDFGAWLAHRGVAGFALGRGYHMALLRGAPDLQRLLAVPGLAGLFRLSAADKIGLRPADRAPGEPVDVTIIRLLPDGGTTETRREGIAASEARRLAEDPAMLAVYEEMPPRPTIHRIRASTHTDDVQLADTSTVPATYGGTIGRGVVVAVVDTGTDATHPDFLPIDGTGASRVVGDPPADGQAHGTMVASVVAGAGHASLGYGVREFVGTPYQWRGMAPGVERIVSIVNTNRRWWFRAFLDEGALVSNHSYTQSRGDYDYDVRLCDAAIRNGPIRTASSGPPRVVVFAAANNGMGSGLEDVGVFLRGFYSILSPGKNLICVGGSNVNDDSHAVGASKGPTLDGRLKPDVVAGGYADQRPPNGVPFAVDEIRLHAVDGSGAVDRVWSFDGGDLEGWTVTPAPPDLVVAGGEVAGTSLGQAQFVLDTAAAPIDAAAYDRVEIRMRMQAGPAEGRNCWPRFWVVAWDNAGDEGLDVFRYPPFDPALRGSDELQVHALALAGDGQWASPVRRLMLWPVVYDDRVVTATLGGGYDGSGGTSLAAPVATGIVALLMERLHERHGADLVAAPLHPSTYKAMLVHTAEDIVHETPDLRDLPNPDTGAPTPSFVGPDFATGYGRVDAERAVRLIDAHGESHRRWTEQSIEHGRVHVFHVPVRAGVGGPLRVTLAWDDAPGANALAVHEPQLVNDLDLVVVDPEGVAHFPWALDPLPWGGDESLATGIDPIAPADVVAARRCTGERYWVEETASCEDHLNNVEQVLIDSPAEGWFEIRVGGTDVPEGPQVYSLVLSQECTAPPKDR